MTRLSRAVLIRDIYDVLLIEPYVDGSPNSLDVQTRQKLAEVQQFLKAHNPKYTAEMAGERAFSIYRSEAVAFRILPGDALCWRAGEREIYKIEGKIFKDHWHLIGEPLEVDDTLLRLSRVERMGNELVDIVKEKTSENKRNAR